MDVERHSIGDGRESTNREGASEDSTGIDGGEGSEAAGGVQRWASAGVCSKAHTSHASDTEAALVGHSTYCTVAAPPSVAGDNRSGHSGAAEAAKSLVSPIGKARKGSHTSMVSFS